MNDLSWTLGPEPFPSGRRHSSAASPSVLVVGRASFREQLSATLRHGNLAERWAHDEGAARAALNRAQASLVVLDGGLSAPTDFSICARLAALARCPVVMVAAGEEEDERIIALGLGADDCVSATCGPRELLARIQARLRRNHQDRWAMEGDEGTTLAFGEWRLDLVRRHVLCPEGRLVGLGGLELTILQGLSRNRGRVTPAAEIIQWASLDGRALTENHLRVQIFRLRSKLGRDGGGRMAISNVRGKGYIIVDEPGPVNTDPSPASATNLVVSATNPAISATNTDAARPAAR